MCMIEYYVAIKMITNKQIDWPCKTLMLKNKISTAVWSYLHMHTQNSNEEYTKMLTVVVSWSGWNPMYTKSFSFWVHLYFLNFFP